MPTLKLTYYPDITQHRSDGEVREAIVGFSAILSDQLSTISGQPFTIDVLPVVDVRTQTDMIATGACQIALAKPSSYVYAHRRNAQVLPAAVAQRLIDGVVGDTYFAQLYTNTSSGITSMEDLASRCRGPRAQRPSIGFGDSFSTANFLVPAAILMDHGLHPLTRFRRVEFLGGHDGVVEAVYSGIVDVGAGHDGVIVDLAQRAGRSDASQRLNRIARRDIHSDPVAVCVDDTTRAHLSAALLAISPRADVKNYLDVFWGAVQGLGATTHANYGSIESAIDRLQISEADILGS